jgi:hypothetical protein
VRQHCRMQASSSTSSAGFDTAAYDAQRLKLDEQVQLIASLLLLHIATEADQIACCTCLWPIVCGATVARLP